jgi:hypothetical protein
MVLTLSLAGGDVDVVRAREVITLGAAQEAEPVGQDFQGAFAVDRLLVFGEVLQDREHHVLLAQAGGVLDLQGFGEAEQVSRGFCLEFGEMHRVASIGGCQLRAIGEGRPG